MHRTTLLPGQLCKFYSVYINLSLGSVLLHACIGDKHKQKAYATIPCTTPCRQLRWLPN